MTEGIYELRTGQQIEQHNEIDNIINAIESALSTK